MTPTRKPRKLKTPQPCRYCGFVSGTHRHERGLYGVPSYECRNASECGDRLRAKRTSEELARPAAEDLPF